MDEQHLSILSFAPEHCRQKAMRLLSQPLPASLQSDTQLVGEIALLLAQSMKNSVSRFEMRRSSHYFRLCQDLRH